VRGEAYLAADQPVPAAAAFQTVIDHRGIVLADPLDALARLHLARALVQSGDAIRAQDVYRDFLQLWSAADPDLPLLARAKSEYTALGGRPGQ
jgi:cytochrome c-type biogenesis protein CcmH/NrfG